ncbi:hypothetical protein AVEN_38620-1 [Araneus ventricosus]|uniref:Uncharacterized protein n=1 Tax=Araneus ventricosus TaxID=182803 RepID=A0A4Y2NK05_ARAVE|nr:hypothetical protein AVEN_38620-1 [Araneus ventricosus]
MGTHRISNDVQPEFSEKCFRDILFSLRGDIRWPPSSLDLKPSNFVSMGVAQITSESTPASNFKRSKGSNKAENHCDSMGHDSNGYIFPSEISQLHRHYWQPLK